MSWSFIQETLGGILLGWLLGWIVLRLLRKIDDYQVEVLLSIALCMGSYALADAVHMSGPIAAVVAGLFLGNNERNLAMSEQTQAYLETFWQLIDEILNSLLFLLIGLEILAIRETGTYLVLGLVGIACVLVGRCISVLIPIRMAYGSRSRRYTRPARPLPLVSRKRRRPNSSHHSNAAVDGSFPAEFFIFTLTHAATDPLFMDSMGSPA